MNLQGLPRRYPWLPWAGLALGLLAAVAAYALARDRAQSEAGAAFRLHAIKFVHDIELRVNSYSDVLHALRGLFDSSDSVTAAEFRRFASNLQIHERHPGLANVTFSYYVPGPERNAFEARIRRELSTAYPNQPPFSISPPGNRPEYHVVTYQEPRTAGAPSLGMDLASDPARRTAVEHARDSGTVAVSPPLALLRDTGNRSVSVLLRLAVYAGDGVPASVDERRRRYRGLVGAAIRLDDMMARIVDAEDFANYRIRLTDPDGGAVLFDSHAPDGAAGGRVAFEGYAYSAPIAVGDRQWVVSVAPLGNPVPVSARVLPFAIAALVVMLAAMLFAATVLLARADSFAMHDKLTGLYNRRYMTEWFTLELRRAAREGYPVSAILCDLDHFKRINDNWGHQAGDHVLQRFAALLSRSARASDVACRQGGEEFLLLMPGASTDVALQRAERLRAETGAMSLDHGGRDLGAVTVSIGIATYPDHARDEESLLRMADEALYEAKRSGRNRVVCARAVAHEAATASA